MLVKKAVGARSYAIANSFNHSKIKIKNRITMMLKEKSTQWARFKLLLFAPLAVVLLQAFARPEIVRIQESLIDSESTTISQQSQKWTKDYFDEKIEKFPSVFNEKKTQSSSQQKTESVSRKEIAEVDGLKEEISEAFEKAEKLYGKNEIIIKEKSDSIMKATMKGTVIFKIGEQLITLSGDSVDIILQKVKQVQFENLSNNIEQIEALVKSMEKIQIYPVGYTSISSDIDNFKKLYYLNNNHFYSAQQSQDDRKTQIEKRQRERQKQSEERLKENQKRREEQQKQSELRSKERQKRREEQLNQSEERLKENQKRKEEQQKKTEQRLKERQNQIEKRQKEQQKRAEQRGKRN